jgi:ABC-2 type transport system permease protein
MSFTDAASDSKTMARAVRDLTEGFGKRELWLHLGWQDIKQRYRRSVLGPFWITIATGTTGWQWACCTRSCSSCRSKSTCPT